ncbi:MAG TPA: hypothetical protein VII01_00255, partial [Solirubrobacteraceae bacterium]
SSCEAFENYPPGLPGKNLRLAALAPGGLFLAMHAMKLGAMRRSPLGFGWMAKRRCRMTWWTVGLPRCSAAGRSAAT